MKAEEFLDIAAKKQAITQSQTNQLADVVEKHPYFQAARAIHLKGLKQNHHFSYNAELRKVAAYTTDRRILFDYITSAEFNQHRISSIIKNRNEENKRLETFDEALSMNMAEADQVLDPDLFEVSKDESKSQQPAKEENNLEIGKHLEFSRKEAHSFAEWLKLTNAKKIERENSTSTEKEPVKVSSKKFELIDNFIANNPKISPVKEHKSKEVKLVEKGPSNQLMTETLARVYLEQKNYSKAIQAYKILILKNPEKSGLFADQIREIEKIQENKNS
jgi:tetratricopeptide (TPR) repeat protein